MGTRKPNIALLQLCSGNDVQLNLLQIEGQLKQLDESVKLVVLPENALLFADAIAYRGNAEKQGQGRLQQTLATLAQRYNKWLLVGSMPLYQAEHTHHLTSSTLLFDNLGHIQARYDKIHLFDVEVADQQGHYSESDVYQHGQQVVVVDSPVGKLGLSICYDLRFPGLYQCLREQGAEILVIPSAFTTVTGEAHWEVLLRARAIENQCWVLAAAQVGGHSPSRHTWGHSMVVDPWGTIVAEQPERVAPLQTCVDVSLLPVLRRRMPVYQHNRFQTQFRDSTNNMHSTEKTDSTAVSD
ncbi:MAG: carbon-nitrogen hydrolase family protein [Plesiomonas sp.]|uniref:carbon-nitrogen hydrolase family protein n=1 Tax=Plesiomonas sp. TaxID=2486279 RepID=UPI003F310A0E